MPAVASKPQGRAGSSTIVQPQNGQAAGAQVSPTLGKTQQLARSLTSVRKQFFTAEDLKDPSKLHQVIYQVQQGATTALHALGSNPMSSGVMLAGVVFTAGQTQYLNHGLGRAYTGWVTARAQTTGVTGGYGSGYCTTADAASVVLATGGVFVQVPLQHAGPSSGTTVTTGSTGNVKVTAAGVYSIAASFSGSESALTALAITLSVFINGSQATDSGAVSKPNGSATPFSVSTVVLRSLNAGDVVDIRISEASTSANTITVDNAQLAVTPLGSGEFTEATLPSGVTSAQQIGLTSPIAGTFSIWVY